MTPSPNTPPRDPPSQPPDLHEAARGWDQAGLASELPRDQARRWRNGQRVPRRGADPRATRSPGCRSGLRFPAHGRRLLDWPRGEKVIPVRLALFAEMVKAKPWTPATWREVGGAEGVGVAFREETFAAPTAPPHRLHQRAAHAVLKLLLPDPGADLKGPSGLLTAKVIARPSVSPSPSAPPKCRLFFRHHH